MKIKHGFEGERFIIVPYQFIVSMARNPLCSDLFIHSIGNFSNARHHYISRPKGRNECILIYCKSGRGWICVGDTRYEIGPNQVFVIPSGTPHSYGADDSAPWTIYWIHFMGTKAGVFARRMVSLPLTIEPSEESRIKDRLDLFEEIYATLYAELSEEIGAEKLTATAKEFGFGKSFSFGNSSTKASRIDLSSAEAGDIAWASVGQYTTLVNPYHMLTVAGAVANSGTAVHPYAVASVTTPEGDIVEEYETESLQYISSDLANELEEMMRRNVEKNYGDWRFKGLDMCGKTGTAEVSDDEEPHSWFLGFSSNPECPVAIVVVVENGGWGSSAAVPVASAVMESIYKSMA